MTSHQPLLSSSADLSLEQAVASGQGVERPFRCPDINHNDSHASASVNVLKGVWYCYACHAKGKVNSKAVPKDEDLLEMLRPEEAARVYADGWLDWFGAGYYWSDRFPMWVCRMMQLGEDPLTSEATFPVHTPLGKLAGVGRRSSNPAFARYLYPRGWSASQAMFGYELLGRLGVVNVCDVLALVEGAADAAACWEVGVPALACYGAGLHWPQRELVARLSPRLVLRAFDADAAGHQASERTAECFGDVCETVHVDWALAGAKDPADLDPEGRIDALSEGVARAVYRPAIDVVNTWAHSATTYAEMYRKAT